MPAPKLVISSPLEAGPSLCEAQSLPVHIQTALEYVSLRLASRALHATFVLIAHGYQLPDVYLRTPVSPTTPSFALSKSASVSRASTPPPETPTSAISTASAFSFSSASRPAAPRGQASDHSSLMSSRFLSEKSASRWSVALPANGKKWLGLAVPENDRDAPMSPASTWSASSGLECANLATMPVCPGIRMIRDRFRDPKAEQYFASLMKKMERKFRVSIDTIPAADPTTFLLLHNSLARSDVLFSSEGLTVLALDSLYAFKVALAAHVRRVATGRDDLLWDAVDELHRLVITRRGRKLKMGDVLRSYDWLAVTRNALTDVERAYRHAYGGAGRAGPFCRGGETREGDALPGPTDNRYDKEPAQRERQSEAKTPKSVAFAPLPSAADPNGQPSLKIQTSFLPTFSAASSPRRMKLRGSRNKRGGRVFDSLSALVERESATDRAKARRSASASGPDPSPHVLGPRTPHEASDISPTTNGEWQLLMGESSLARMAKIGIC